MWDRRFWVNKGGKKIDKLDRIVSAFYKVNNASEFKLEVPH
jgi:hypothetical protein